MFVVYWWLIVDSNLFLNLLLSPPCHLFSSSSSAISSSSSSRPPSPLPMPSDPHCRLYHVKIIDASSSAFAVASLFVVYWRLVVDNNLFLNLFFSLLLCHFFSSSSSAISSSSSSLRPSPVLMPSHPHSRLYHVNIIDASLSTSYHRRLVHIITASSPTNLLLPTPISTYLSIYSLGWY